MMLAVFFAKLLYKCQMLIGCDFGGGGEGSGV